MNEKFEKLGFYPADILLPKKDVDMEQVGRRRLRPVHVRAGVLGGAWRRPSAMRRPPCA